MNFLNQKAALAICLSASIVILVFLSWTLIGLVTHGLSIQWFRTRSDGFEFAVISPDGSKVATLYRQNDSTKEHGATSIESVLTGDASVRIRVVVPVASGAFLGSSYRMSPQMSYCDNGRFLVVYAAPDTVDIFDGETLALKSSFPLHGLVDGAAVAGSSPTSIVEGIVLGTRFACASKTSIAGFVFWGGSNRATVKLFDLQSIRSAGDLTGAITGDYYNGDIAISPDGILLAIVLYNLNGSHEGGVEVISAKTGQLIKSLALEGNIHGWYQIAFAGNTALMVGDAVCNWTEFESRECDIEPRNRQIRIWEFADSGAVTNLGKAGRETYRWFGGSDDGSTVFAYTGFEYYCGLCSDRHGELLLLSPEFTVWDRRSGAELARSSRLRIRSYSCPFFHLSPCEDYEESPTLSMSGNGKVILAFWPDDVDQYGQIPSARKIGEVGLFYIRKRVTRIPQP